MTETTRRLYLVQHGDAVPKDVDPDRPLSETGRRDVEQVGSLLANAGVRFPKILHSGKTRARETAEILAGVVSEQSAIEAVSGLAPKDATEPWVARVGDLADDVMLVGHLPFMGKLASRLVLGAEFPEVVQFRPGTVVCLALTEEDHWAIAWMVRPGLLKR
jgi:phosphohistidine phosphatase